MKLYLFRDFQNNKVTLGRLFNSNDNFHIHTLELPDKQNKPNISCIPAGIYIAERDYYYKGGYEAFELRNVPERSEIKIHIGNYPSNVKGCIALGTHRQTGVPMVTHSKKAFDKFMNYMKGIDRFKLEIIEGF